MLVLQVSKHDYSSCPMFNERSLKASKKYMAGEEAALARHKIKLIGSWTDFTSHEIFNIFESPSMEEFMKMCMEPEFMEWLSFNDVQTKAVIGRKDVMELLSSK
ncbi:MAG: hypothetical protein A4E32_01543 [Methanomassiliicoccales archaeon PtaU1.Bin124]|nr:MAG: hypothetical protein A4E32_01543 [Methanomassiliicoccales archaeon PtaU1.Bin124]